MRRSSSCPTHPPCSSAWYCSRTTESVAPPARQGEARTSAAASAAPRSRGRNRLKPRAYPICRAAPFVSIFVKTRVAPDSTRSMVSLRLIRSPSPVPAPRSDCLETFDRELDYVFGTLQRLGARPGDMEDLLQE